MCRDTHHLKRLGAGKSIVMPDGARWDLPGMVYGALFSLSREAFALMDGYDERFVGWGCEDTLVGVRALAMGHHLVPVYSAAGHHIAHADRSPTKWQEFAANRRIYHQLLTQPYSVGQGHYLSRARDRIEAHIERRPLPAEGMADLQTAQAVLDGELEDPHCYGKYLHSLGRYAEAAAAFARIVGSSDVLGWAAFDRGKALRAADRPREAIPHLQEAAGRLPDSAWPLVELAFAHAAASDFGAARRALEAARILAPANPSLVYLLGRGAQHHAQRGALYLRQGDFALARRDHEATLMLNPDDVSALLGRATALVALEQTGPAKLTLDRIARLRPDTPGLAEQRSALAQVVDRTRPLPHARSIAERTQSIPGWFGADEAELLIALVLRAAATSDPEPVVLTEIGAYCGRATLTMALTLRALEVRPTSRCSHQSRSARVLAVAEPTLGPAPDGRPPFHVLREELARFHVRDLVVCAPDEEPEPWRHHCRLLLVDGRHDRRGIEDDLERFLPALAGDGLLVFHDYAHYFPDVERTVHELLVDNRFAFVAHVGSLIALSRTALSP
jgi:tetratricopeptide (TPR) repeat protein